MMLEDTIRDAVAELEGRHGERLLSVFVVGSALHADEYVEGSSDVDLVVVVDEDVDRKFDTLPAKQDVDVQTHTYGRAAFERGLAEGEPMLLLAVRGSPVYDSRYAAAIKTKVWEPTEQTPRLLLDSALSSFSHAMMEYFAVMCPECYARFCYHAAKLALMAYVLREKGVLEDDRVALAGLVESAELAQTLGLLFHFRKSWEGIPFRDSLDRRRVEGQDAPPLLLVERLLERVLLRLEGEGIAMVNDLIDQLPDQLYDHILSASLTDDHRTMCLTVVKGKELQHREYVWRSK